MPIITAYIGASHFCLLLYVNKDTYYFFYSPYIYLPNVFSNHTSEQDFYVNLIKLFCKSKKVSFEDCNIYISGFLNVPDFEHKNINIVKYKDLLVNIKTQYPVLVNDFAFSTKYFMVSHTNYQNYYQSNYLDPLKLNKSTYSNLTATSLSSQLLLDKELLTNIHNSTHLRWDQNTPIVFTDSRFYGERNKPLDYIFMFSSIKDYGVYDIYIDRVQSIVLINMLNTVLNKEELPFSNNTIEHVGTLATSIGDISCIISSNNNGPYGITSDNDTIKKVHLEPNKEYNIQIKNRHFGIINKKVHSGKLGLILDNRENKIDAFDSSSNFELYAKFLSD